VKKVCVLNVVFLDGGGGKSVKDVLAEMAAKKEDASLSTPLLVTLPTPIIIMLVGPKCIIQKSSFFFSFLSVFLSLLFTRDVADELCFTLRFSLCYISACKFMLVVSRLFSRWRQNLDLRVLTREAEGRITTCKFSRQCKAFMDG